MQFDTVTIKVTDGIKTSDYAPNKQYELTGFKTNATEDDISAGILILQRAGDRFLGRAVAPVVSVQSDPSPPTSSGSPASTDADAGEPQRRTRRTRAQIEADEAAAKAAQDAAAGNTTSGSATDASTATQAATPGPQPSSEPSTASATDEWDVGGAAAPEITDADLNSHCATHAARVKSSDKVKAVIVEFKPADWDANKKFSVQDIPQGQRKLFTERLSALTAE